MGSESFSASARISEAFLALRPPGSRIVAKTVCPLRASVSVNSLPNPVLDPVIRTTCLEFMGVLVSSLWQLEPSLMRAAKPLIQRVRSLHASPDGPPHRFDRLKQRSWHPYPGCLRMSGKQRGYATGSA